jgi:hypothetical protein
MPVKLVRSVRAKFEAIPIVTGASDGSSWSTSAGPEKSLPLPCIFGITGSVSYALRGFTQREKTMGQEPGSQGMVILQYKEHILENEGNWSDFGSIFYKWKEPFLAPRSL